MTLSFFAAAKWGSLKVVGLNQQMNKILDRPPNKLEAISAFSFECNQSALKLRNGYEFGIYGRQHRIRPTNQDKCAHMLGEK